MAQKPRLGYWDIRGLAAPLRYLLAYAGEDFEDVRYTVGPPPQMSRESWLKEKFTLGLEFPNLPYYIDDKVKLTETNVIFRYLARKYNLYGDDNATAAKIDLILDVTMDFRNGFVRLCYSPEEKFNDDKEKYLKSAQEKMEKFEAVLGDQKFFAGDKVTMADFHIYEILDQHFVFHDQLFNTCPKLKQFCQRFRELPAIAKYLASDKFAERPVNNPSAAWK